MIFIKFSVKQCDISVWLITGSNPADVNGFLSHTGKWFTLINIVNF